MQTHQETATPRTAAAKESSEAAVRAGEHAASWLKSRLTDALESYAAKLGAVKVPKLLDQRERVRRELRTIPERMQKMTNQAALVLELVDDYMDGHYRDIPWRSLIVAAGALLYSVSPGDVVPDVLPLLGQFDDAFVIGVAMRVIRKDLQRYVAFKGYAQEKYF